MYEKKEKYTLHVMFVTVLLLWSTINIRYNYKANTIKNYLPMVKS